MYGWIIGMKAIEIIIQKRNDETFVRFEACGIICLGKGNQNAYMYVYVKNG